VVRPRQGSERVFLRAWTSLRQSRATRKSLRSLGVSGTLWWRDMGQCDEHSPPDRVLAAFLRSGTAVMFRSRPEFIQPEVPPAIYEIPRWLTSA